MCWKCWARCTGTMRKRAMAVLHRKNALFYRTLHGAEVGDLFMTLIHTCQLCGANSFDYLTELQRHVRELAANPAEWMPWNYRQTLAPPGV
jgi:transposase